MGILNLVEVPMENLGEEDLVLRISGLYLVLGGDDSLRILSP